MRLSFYLKQMEITEVKRLARRVPRLAAAERLTVSALGGGITNENLRLDTADGSFVLRVSGQNTERLGIDRLREAHNHRVAAAIGVAPEVVDFIEPEGYLLTRFVVGNKISSEQMRTPEMIRRVVAALRLVHDGPTFAGSFSPFSTFESYLRIAREKGAALPKNFAFIEKFKRDCERALYHQSPLAPRPIHADLLNENFLKDDTRLWILDWEYSGMGDVYFDLANFADHHEFGDEEERFLLETYCGEFRAGDGARLKLMRIMSNLREAMWGTVQSRLSTLDFDFAAYADQFFGRLLRLATDGRYPQWLRLAAGIE